LKDYAESIGFLAVASAPLVRSSYKAHEYYANGMAKLNQIGDVSR
jgi:lipoate synthase